VDSNKIQNVNRIFHKLVNVGRVVVLEGWSLISYQFLLLLICLPDVLLFLMLGRALLVLGVQEFSIDLLLGHHFPFVSIELRRCQRERGTYYFVVKFTLFRQLKWKKVNGWIDVTDQALQFSLSVRLFEEILVKVFVFCCEVLPNTGGNVLSSFFSLEGQTVWFLLHSCMGWTQGGLQIWEGLWGWQGGRGRLGQVLVWN